MERAAWKFVLIAVGLLLAPVCLWAQSGAVLEVGKFSASQVGQAIPDGWKPLTFKKIPKHTSYEVVKDEDVTVVKAVSEASASGLIKQVVIDPKEFPIVRWRWKIDNVLQRSDVALKEGDDFPARLYITFEYEPDKVSFGKKLKFKVGQALFGDIPIAALNYIWETKTPVGTIVENAYTDFAKMVIVESGTQKVGMWIDEERNVYEDYKQAFREEPPMINGVAIMSDTDNTKEQATAYYGDIVFQRSVKTSAQ
jgi:CO dehydrogenase/acetyl-CoA synthase gamma subunit (corrinoid Fe-S protein)